MIEKLSNKQFYTQQINLVKAYINDNLDKKINIKTLAEISCFSPFHFHRISRALLEEPIGSYISRIRLEMALKSIRYSKQSIATIAYNVGFETPSSLSKAFKNNFGISPSQYRNHQSVTTIKTANNVMEISLNIKKPKIVTVEEKQCIYYSMKGNYQTLDYGKAWELLWQEVKNQKLFTAGIEHIGQSFDDPNVTEANKIRYDACLVIHKKAKPNGEIGTKVLKGGKFVTFLYTGSYTYFAQVYDYIFNHWLLNSDYELRDEAVRELYKNNPNRTEENKLKTEIWLPIK